jgi:hypothetical protein
LAGCAFRARRSGEQACELRINPGGAVKNFYEGLPLLWRSNELALIGEKMFSLQAGALQDNP